MEGHENIAAAAVAAESAASAPDGAAAGGEGDIESTTGDPEVDDILRASKSVSTKNIPINH